MNTFEIGKTYRSVKGGYEVEIKKFLRTSSSVKWYSIKETHHIYGNTFVADCYMQVNTFSNGVEFCEKDGDIIVADNAMTNKEIYELYVDFLGNSIERDEYAGIMKHTLNIK